MSRFVLDNYPVSYSTIFLKNIGGGNHYVAHVLSRLLFDALLNLL